MIGGLVHPDHLVAFDLETTGLSPRSDRILEIGAVRYDRALRPIDELQVVVDPQMPIPLAIQRLVGLTDEDVLGAPSPAEGAHRLDRFCGDAALIAHGGTFDLLFLRALLSESFGSRLVYDTLDLARILLPTYESHSLPLLSRRLGITHERPHRALSDAQATGDLFRILVGAGRSLPVETKGEMRRVAAQASGPAPGVPRRRPAPAGCRSGAACRSPQGHSPSSDSQAGAAPGGGGGAAQHRGSRRCAARPGRATRKSRGIRVPRGTAADGDGRRADPRAKTPPHG